LFFENNRVRRTRFLHSSGDCIKYPGETTNMEKGRPGSALLQLRSLFAAGTATGLTDSELLERYMTKRAESAEAATAAEMAFAALVDRHGAMVWGVCHRVIGDSHEAEDAFQATFLVLVRKAGSVRAEGSLGRWLYGVAHRVARRTRAQAKRRGYRIGQASARSSDDPVAEVELEDVRNAVGEELDQLPMKYRCPVELCHLQGMTYDQAAQQLNWPVATVKSRLTRGRLKLKDGLTRRGLAPASVGIAMAFSGKARAAVPQAIVQSTAHAATSCAAGVFQATVTELTEGVLKMMMWEKLRLVAACAVVAIGLAAEALSQQATKNRLQALPPSKTGAQPADNSKEQAAADPRWIKILPNGATIEVVGVSSHPSGPDTWWRPDGTMMQQPPCDRSGTRISSDGNVVFRAVVARVTNVPAGAEEDWWINEAHGGSSGPAMQAGKPVPGLSEVITEFPSGLSTCTVLFKVAAGPWHTVQTWGKNQGALASRDGASFIFGEAIATKVGTTLAVTHNIQDTSVQLVAIDRDDKEHPAKIRSGSGVKDFQQIVGEFDLSPDQIKEFRVQTRPFERVEIPGIALKRESSAKK
jgi:RNA polymerase sigma factor (sigma-70 family)